MLNWTAVATHSKYEHRVNAELDRMSFEHYLPTFSAKRQYFTRKPAIIHCPVFPGYVFARLDDAELRERTRVAQITGVCALLRGAVTEPEMAHMRLLVDMGARPYEAAISLTRGQRVRMKSGPLAGVEGIFEAQGSHGQLIVTIEMLGRTVATPINRCQVEPIDRRSDSAYDCFARAALNRPAVLAGVS